MWNVRDAVQYCSEAEKEQHQPNDPPWLYWRPVFGQSGSVRAIERGFGQERDSDYENSEENGEHDVKRPD